jgi:hypothetical protein
MRVIVSAVPTQQQRLSRTGRTRQRTATCSRRRHCLQAGSTRGGRACRHEARQATRTQCPIRRRDLSSHAAWKGQRCRASIADRGVPSASPRLQAVVKVLAGRGCRSDKRTPPMECGRGDGQMALRRKVVRCLWKRLTQSTRAINRLQQS